MTLPGKAKTKGRWTLTDTGILPTGDAFPDFPIARYDSGQSLYQEALLDGQYLSAHLSGMGRAKPRRWIWDELRDGAANDRPLRTRQHAFLIEADGQLLVDGWELVAQGGNDKHAVLTLEHKQRHLKVEVHTELDDTPFFTRHLVITNVG